MSSLHISISAETIAHLGPIPISNSMLTSSIVSALIILFAIIAGSSIKKTGKPGRLQAVCEMIVEGLFNFALDLTGSRAKATRFFPLVATFFIWIMFNNWFGLLPGVGSIGFQEEVTEAHAQVIPSTLLAATQGSAVAQDEHLDTTQIQEQAEENAEQHLETTETHEGTSAEEEHAETVFVPYFRAGTADLNTTIALALISVGATQYFGFQSLGLGYLKKYFDFSNPIKTFVGLLELVLELAKIMSFAFRLFGNIFAGEVLLAVMTFLVPVIVPMPFYGLELFVGLIQGVVFAMLSLVFFNLATIGHGEEH